MLFAGGEKTVQRQGVFPHVRVDQQGNLGVEITEGGERGEGYGDEIADAADIENDLIGPFFEQASAEESDHRMKVLPLGRGGVNARWARALFRVARTDFVEQVDQRKSRGWGLYKTAL